MTSVAATPSVIPLACLTETSSSAPLSASHLLVDDPATALRSANAKQVVEASQLFGQAGLLFDRTHSRVGRLRRRQEKSSAQRWKSTH